MRLLTLFLSLLSFSLSAQTVCSLESRERLDAVLTDLSQKDLSGKSIQEMTLEIGQSFLGTPYVEKTLELPGEEKLVINLTGLDCTTYLETVVTLARIAMLGDLSFKGFEQELERIRYQDGVRKDYSSRLHYFSDWIYQNQEKGIIRDITKEIGGTIYPNQPTFMSENPQFYTQLSNSDFLKSIKTDEAEIAKRTYHFIPKAEIESLEKNIQSGDLIAITTSMKNLDIVHVGFAIEKEGRIHLMHAGTGNMQVEISAKPLSEYLKGSKSQSGIMVCRLLENKMPIPYSS
ncbi:N-acetylmuramoyl-L-alanine amidase-like domain-containing protein [Algoriphagus sp.]|uniref:N-acetylmuramoyl-L-alanine amidase-like domain-containing protein n=1 Tax=Algoriphagus sp. TaxID=1872435 RepID=UPI00391DBD99